MSTTPFLEILQLVTHYSLHLLAPGLIAWIFFRSQWKQAWLIMLATMVVDLDHLLADPVFAPGRCSIGYHPLHSWYAIGGYATMAFIPRVRIAAIGLLFHMFTDFQDCLWMQYITG